MVGGGRRSGSFVTLQLLLKMVAGVYLLLQGVVLHVSAGRPVFIHYTTADGLSRKDVISVYHDRYGFYWFGTFNGVNRFDGYSFRAFLPDTLPGSLPGPMVGAFAEDPSGVLWIGTDRGLVWYDRRANRFERFSGGEGNPDPLATGFIRALYAGRDTILWVETMDGVLHRVDLRTRMIRRFQHNPPSQPDYPYHVIKPDDEGYLWIGGRGMGVYRFDPLAERFRHFPPAPAGAGGKRESDVACYFADSRGRFWVTGYDGAYVMNRGEGTFRKMLAVSTWSVAEDHDGVVWLGTGNGLYRFVPGRGGPDHFAYDPDDPGSVQGLNIYQVMVDRTGNLWACHDHGISMLPAGTLHLRHFAHERDNPNSLSSDRISCLLAEPGGAIWAGTAGAGLNRYDPSKGMFTRYEPGGGRDRLASGKVSALHLDRGGRLWVGLWAGVGFQELNPATGVFRTFRFDPETFKSDWYSAFAEDSRGNFYVGFWGGPGLVIFDRERFRVGACLRDTLQFAFESRLVTALLCDRSDHLWIATSTVGLHRYDPSTGRAQHLGNRMGDPLSLPANTVKALLEDPAGNVWAGGQGISRWIPGTDRFRSYGKADGLTGDAVTALVAGDDGRIWIGTQSGLSVFSPADSSFIALTTREGLPFDGFTCGTREVSGGGIVFGGSGGMIRFHPDSLFAPLPLPPVVLTGFSVLDALRYEDLTEREVIGLRYDENFFTFAFASPGAPGAGRLVYRYRLEGFDQLWRTAPAADRKAVYTNVPPGDYTFRVSVRPLPWREEVSATVRLTISPPFWHTWWFYLLEAATAGAIILLIVRAAEARNRQKLRNTELKQKLLRLQMNPHFIFNSLSAIQHYIYEQKAPEAGRYLADFARLIRLILNNSRVEYIPLSQEIDTLRLYLELQSLRFNHRFTWTIGTDPEIDTEYCAIPPMIAQPFIENALEHGLKKKGGTGRIMINFARMSGMIRFEVTDDGIGIDQARRSDPAHHSLATAITLERLRMLNHRLKRKIRFEITDRSRLDPSATGTLVRFDIPYMDLQEKR